MPSKSQYTPDYLKNRIEKLKSGRSNWVSHWRECAKYALPRKEHQADHAHGSNHGKTIASTWTGTGTGDQKHAASVFDATAIRANEDLASALHGMLTNPSTLWFELNSGVEAIDELPHVKQWLQSSADKMHTAFNNSNFQSQIHEMYLELGCFGTAPIYVEEDPVDLIRFATSSVFMTYCAENHRSQVDTVYREVPMTNKQIVDKWGDKVPQDIKDAYKEKPFDVVSVWHCVEPRRNVEPKRGQPMTYPYASVWYYAKENVILSESGYQEFPWSVPRWTKLVGEPYGRSPTMKALTDIKMLNAISKTIIKAAEKAVDPPLLLNSDGMMRPPRTFPGGVNIVESQAIGGLDPIRPLQHGGDVRLGLENEQARRDSVLRAYFNDQLNLAPQPNMTATEVIQRQEEKLRQLGPMLGRLQDELLRPLINRAFAILLRAGAFEEMPEELLEGSINVRYSSPIAKTQRVTEAQALLRWGEIVSPVAPALPQMFENVNPDKLARGTWHMVGLPADWLYEQKEVDQNRAVAQQEQQEQEELAQTIAVAEAAGKLPQE